MIIIIIMMIIITSTLAVANARLPKLAGSNGPLYCVDGQKPKSNSHIVQIQVAGLAYWLP